MNHYDALAFVGDGVYQKQSAETLLAAMDRHGIQKTLIAPTEEAVTVFNEAGNTEIQRLVREFPDRFLGYAVANPWYGAQAVQCLRRALDGGLAAVYFDSSIQGFTISDALVDPLIEVCQAYDVPAYFHTGTPAFALPMQLHYLARRHPKVRFIMGHCGANDFAGDALPALYERDNIWLETSMTLTVTQLGILEAAPDRVIFGSATPRSDLAHEQNKLRATRCSQAVLDRVLSENLRQLLGGRL